ncbi:putative serine carboxypeptidase CPVL [Ixodes scapularis]
MHSRKLSSEFRQQSLGTGQLGDVGDPLFLTPLIEAGRLDEAKALSRVGSLGDVEDVPSHAGFLTVNKQLGSNMFFWFYPAKENPETAPVVLWLQGGPGAPSLFGLFSEHGPYYVAEGGVPKLREVTWARRFSMLYIDNPVGTGYSFTGKDQGYARNETDVGRDLLEALQQFFTLFHEFTQNEFYASGESYAGKYVPAVAYAIHTAVQPRVKINLKGIAIGDGMVEPSTMFDYADFLYQIGLVDSNQAAYIREASQKAKQFIDDGRYLDAFYIFDALWDGDVVKETSYFKNVTGLDFYYNFLLSKQPKQLGYYNAFVQTALVRKAIHVGKLTFNDGDAVKAHLLEDIMKSVKPWLTVLMENYKVMIYNGQLDIIIAYPLTANMISAISWSGAKAFEKAPRKIWLTPSGEDVAGYVRQHSLGFKATQQRKDSAAQEEAPAASLLTWPTWSLTDNNRRMAHRGTFPFPSVGCLQKHLPPLQSLGHDKAMPALTVFMTQASHSTLQQEVTQLTEQQKQYEATVSALEERVDQLSSELNSRKETGVAPYEDTPRKRRDASLPPSAPPAAEDSSPATPPPEPPRRVGDTNWCDCGRCTAMPTTRECFCCRELPQAVRKQPAECITVHTDFFKLCLDVAVLAVAYCEVREKGLEHSHELHEKYRFVAYRQFTRWMWGRLGAGNRRVLPACVVEKIRKTFPSQQYTGFKYPPLDCAPVDC